VSGPTGYTPTYNFSVSDQAATSAVTVTLTMTVSNSPCAPVSTTFVLTINPTPVLTPTQSTSVCAASTFNYTPTGTIIPAGTTYAWSAPTGSGFAGSGLGGSGTTLTDNLTITSGTTTTTATYSVTPTSGSCTGATFTVSVTLYYQPALSDQTTSSCSGQLFVYAPTGTIPSGTTYAWSAPSGSGFTGGASASGQNYLDGNLTLVSSLTPATATYTVTPLNGTCSGTPFNVSVTVNSSPIITAQSTATCTNTAFNFTPTGAIPPGTSYAWNTPTGSGYTGGTSASGQSDVNGILINSSASPVTAIYSVTATAGSCSGTAFNVSVTVNPTPVIGDQPATACSSQTFSYAPTGSVVPGTTTYAWSSPTLGGGLSGTAGAQTGQATLTDNLANSTASAVTATYSVTPTAAGGCTGTPFTVTVTVDPTPVIADQSTSICGAVAISYTITGAIIPAGTTYAWSSPAGSGFTGGAAASGQSNLNGTLTNTTNAAVTATYSVTPTSGGCTGASFNVSVTLNPTPFIADQSTSICGTVAISYTITGSIIPSGTTYDWSAPTGSGFTGGAAASGQSNLNGTLTNTTSAAVTATYSVTPTSGGCTGASFNVSVTLNPAAFIADQSTSTCGTVPISYTITGSIIPSGTTYDWSTPTGSGFTGGASASGQSDLNGTLTNTTNAAVTATYSVTPTSGACTGASFNVSVTVNPAPFIADQSTNACSSQSFGYTITGSIIPSGTTYAWSTPTGSGFTGGASASGQSDLNGTLTNTTNAAVTATYSVTPTSGACTGASFNVSVTIDPVPSLPDQYTNACSDVAIVYTPAGGTIPSGTTYAWNAPTGSGFSGGASGSGSDLTATLTNSGASAVTATYSVTPTAGSCTGTAFTVVVTLNPSPSSASISDNLDPCNGGHTAYVDVTGGSSPYTFTLTYTGSTYFPYTYTGSVPIELDAHGADTITISGITDAYGCPAASVTGSPVSYSGYALTGGNSQSCTVLANSTQVFFDGSAKLMAKITAGSTALGSTTVITTVDGSVQQFGPTSMQSYLQRHFQITPATNAPANVCLYISDAEVSALNVYSAIHDNHGAPAYYQTFATDLSNANVTKYDGGAETPTSHTTSLTQVITSITATHNPIVDGASYSGAWEMCFNVSGFSGFYIHANNVHNDPLPVTLISFTATAEDNKFIQLDWATASETDNSGFQIERSTNGTEFDAIGWAQGHGNSTVMNSYRYSDLTALPGIVYYYRLKQVDLDGRFAYSNIASASLTGDLGFTLETLIPNPANSQVAVGVISNVNAMTTITMTDMLGRVVVNEPWEMSIGYNTQKFDLSKMAEGAYVVTIYSGNIRTSKRLVVTR
jgi:hypothetical protein